MELRDLGAGVASDRLDRAGTGRGGWRGRTVRHAIPSATTIVDRDGGRRAEPVYLVRAAETMPRLRRSCETEGPEPLRARQVYAPPEFLTAA